MTKTLLLALLYLTASSFVRADDDVSRTDDWGGIWLYSFTSEVCLFEPYGSPQYFEGVLSPVPGSNCIETDMNSIKALVHNPNEMEWIERTNTDDLECAIITFKRHGCHEGDEIERAPMPEMLGQCLMSLEPEQMIRSVSFQCVRRSKGVDEQPAITSWSIGVDDKPTPFIGTTPISPKATYFPLVDPPLPQNEDPKDIDPNDVELHDNKDQVVKPRGVVAPRDGSADIVRASIWLLHPWAQSIMCFLCEQPRGGEEAIEGLECTAGPVAPGHCGNIPPSINGEPLLPEISKPKPPKTSKSTKMPTVRPTKTKIPTTTGGSTTSAAPKRYKGLDDKVVEPTGIIPPPGVPPPKRSLQKRGNWKRDVYFMSPFHAGTPICAEAEWVDRGSLLSEMRIRGAQKCEKNVLINDENENFWPKVAFNIWVPT